jgi:2-iminobutanoate/2-iminopropanoate deaminase
MLCIIQERTMIKKIPLFVLAALMAGCTTAAKITRSAIQTSKAPAAIGPYSQAVLVDRTLYLAGQLGIDPVSGKIVEGGVEAQTMRAMLNLQAILNEAGFTFDDVVVTQAFLADMNDFAAFNKIYASFFTARLPARAVVQPSRLPRDGAVEIMMTAVKTN